MELVSLSNSLSPYTYLVFVSQFFGYILFSGFLQYLFYYRRGEEFKFWKIQSQTSSIALCHLWGFPIASLKPNRGKYHGIFTCMNLCMASMFVAATTEFSVRGWNLMRFDSIADIRDLMRLVFEVIRIVFWQCFVEYYWHRLMHLRYFYKMFHKFHHHYKSPEPWDDMYIHPIEACGYYCILYSPPFLFSTHLYSFLVYMAIMGTCGVLDHSGIYIHLPGIYNTCEHDRHHEKFEVNYSFPFPFMDILHGTFDGEYLGKRYKPIRRND